MKNVIQSAIFANLFKAHYRANILDHADSAAVAGRIGADRTYLVLAHILTYLTVFDVRSRVVYLIDKLLRLLVAI